MSATRRRHHTSFKSRHTSSSAYSRGSFKTETSFTFRLIMLLNRVSKLAAAPRARHYVTGTQLVMAPPERLSDDAVSASLTKLSRGSPFPWESVSVLVIDVLSFTSSSLNCMISHAWAGRRTKRHSKDVLLFGFQSGLVVHVANRVAGREDGSSPRVVSVRMIKMIYLRK